MSKRQWIWLIIAIAVFAAMGVTSVVSNAWAERSRAESLTLLQDSFVPSIGGTDATPAFPEEPFLAKLDIEGVIMESGGGVGLGMAVTEFDLDYILDYIDRLMDCEENRCIVLFVDSGGGEVKASDEVYLKLMDYKAATGRPVYAYFDGTACSGAYYIASAADTIWANRNCLCVNIGVYTQVYNLHDLFEKYGVKEIMIKSSENKGIGAMGQEWTEEQLAIYQSIVDLWYDQFLGVVAEGRGMTKEQVKALDDGREMLAPQALDAGFIDGICRYEEFRDYLLKDGDVILYEEEPVIDPFTQLIQNFYGKLERLVPRSEAEILRDLMNEHDGITVMAYAG